MGLKVAFPAALAALVLQSSIAIATSEASSTGSMQSYEPAAKWVVDFDDKRCFAARRFRSESGELVLGISPWPMFKWVKVVIEKPGRANGIIPLNGKVSVDGGKAYDETVWASDSVNEGRIIYTFSLSDAAFEALKTGRRVHVKTRQLDADIPLTSLEPVIAKLEECLPLLLEHWGFPRDKQALLASYPDHDRPLPLKASDYPAAAIRRGAVGVVEVLVNVAVDGRALDCKIIRSSGHKDLDDTSCEKLVRRGNFKPGRDRSGNPVVSPFYFSVNWFLPY